MTGLYRLPALPTLTAAPTDSSGLPTNAYASDNGRVSARTLPSNALLVAQKFTASNMPSPGLSHPYNHLVNSSRSSPSKVPPPPPLMKLAVHHSTSIPSTVASSLLMEQSSHLCLGLLTTHLSTGLILFPPNVPLSQQECRLMAVITDPNM